ncbi:GspE/PulE family protein [Aliidiomarina indica]|uniref:GspE/PulE family protein n=1 Tax=Aliidiomarina indica TaxID=2749147 RepID=UPI0018908955|nr:ATPase, T2SS/T4P/T4SS family [Aliidiomarina indica]
MLANPQLERELSDFIVACAEGGDSDLHLEPLVDGAQWRGRYLGSLAHRQYLSSAQAIRTVAAIKTAAGMDTTERRLPQDGRLSIQSKTTRVDCRVNTLATLHGEKIVIRLQIMGEQALPLQQLGLLPEQYHTVLEELSKREGLVLVTGPTGSGKTRTLYAMLQHLNAGEMNICTVEDPVEIALPGINQVPIRAHVGLTFATALRAMLRQDPDVLMIGEIRDQETALIACQAAQTGHLVFATLHASSPLAAIIRLQQLSVQPNQLAACLNLLINQRLCVVNDKRVGVFDLRLGDGSLQQALLSDMHHIDRCLQQPSADVVGT